jgi:hypothetical protein
VRKEIVEVATVGRKRIDAGPALGRQHLEEGFLKRPVAQGRTPFPRVGHA